MTSVEFVEKALIGSLLNDSTRRDELPWLRAEDFTNPLCLAIWRHLESGNPPHCHPLTDLVDLSEALGRDYELHPRLRSPAELATLQIQTPEKPAVAEYGRILVEATIHRQVAAMGLRLESLATREPKQIVDSVANALASLERLDQRWQVSMGQRAQVDVDHVAVAMSVCADELSPPAAPDAETHPADHDMDQQLAERAVIGAAIYDWPPGARAEVMDNVRRSDFTDSRAAATWQAVEHLAEHDAPIDEITVAWQCLRARSRTGDGLTVQELRETRDAALFHEMGAATLARSTVTRVAGQAKIAISRCAEDLRIDPETVIDSVATHHLAVAAAGARLIGEDLANEPLAAVKNQLLDRTRRSPVQVASPWATCERPSSYTAELGSSQISP
ncbi:MAG: DnaB-like helicase N-terminal domain-containing protein [Dermatophilaceae bacterium]